MLLYDSAVSGNCYKVRLLLAQLGIEYERRDVDVVDRANRKELLGELNPGAARADARPRRRTAARRVGRDPVVPGGRAPRTSRTIAYERAQVLQWMFFEQYSHEPYVAVRAVLAHAPDRGRPRRSCAERQRVGYLALDVMERHLAARQFLVADRYSIADIALYAYTHVADEGGFDLGGYPAIRAWLERVAAQPGHVAIDA